MAPCCLSRAYPVPTQLTAQEEHSMRTRIFASLLALVCVSVMSLSAALAQNQNNQGSSFRLTSSTFANNTTLPISAIFDKPRNPPTSPNPCSIDGSPGGD